MKQRPGGARRALRTLVPTIAAIVAMRSALAAQSLAVAPGARIAVVLTARISSESAHVGDPFAFRTTRDAKLGGIDVPAGSLGHGRIAVAVAATAHRNGSLALQADAIDLGDGRSISVNVDTSRPIRGHYTRRHAHLTIVPLVIAIVPIEKVAYDGDLVLESGAPFAVLTTLPRATLAPLLRAPASDAPLPAASPNSSAAMPVPPTAHAPATATPEP